MEEPMQPCRGTHERVYLAAALAAMACLGTAPALHAQSRLAGFSIVLVLGANEGAASDAAPPVVRKALDDLKDFLPFKSYRVLDTQVVASSTSTSTRLSGPDGQVYEVKLQAKTAIDRVNVMFTLGEPGAPTSPADAASRPDLVARLEKQRIGLEKGIADWRSVPKSDAVERKLKGMEADLDVLRQAIAAARAVTLVDTTFDMALGETVVVGTSRIRGGKALIVLLTARSSRPQ
jgi:hypothetical protein